MVKGGSLSLRNALIVALALAALLPLLVVGVYTRAVTEDRIERGEFRRLENRTLHLSQELGAALSVYLADLRTLERLPSLLGLIRAQLHGGTDALSGSTALQWQHRLEQIFLGFAEAKEHYRALRFVGVDGRELVGVEKSVDGTALLSANEKRLFAQPFIEQTLGIAAGHFYFSDQLQPGHSPEGGKSEKPILRFAVPVADPLGDPRGVLLTDVDARWIFDWLARAERLDRMRLILVDGEGRRLYSRDNGSFWGRPDQESEGQGGQFAHLWRLINQGSGFGDRGEEGGEPTLAYAPIRIGSDRSKPPWLLVATTYPGEVKRVVSSIHGVLLALFGISLIVAVGLGYWFSATWVVRPIDALLAVMRRFGRGELTARALTVANNEIGRLAQVFNDMAHFHEAALAREREHAEQLRRAAHVFEYTRDGVMITDREGNIVAVNKAFTEITGYTQEEALGRNPRMLKSYRHDAGFYESMWRSLIEEGHWQGEVWNRRKSGEVFPEWLTITRVDDDEGETTNFVAVFSDFSSHKRGEERLSHLAHYDILTDLPNRLLFGDRVRHALHRAKREGERCALLFLDLDRFKPVNDRYGHLFGDRVLQAVAGRLSQALREEDTISRLGGDEFAVLLEQVGSRADAEEVAKKLAGSLQSPVEIDGRVIHVGVSVGISLYPEDGITFEALLKSADQAMYEVKAARARRDPAAGDDG
ncbi:MAG: hypothetical protein Kow006_14370 [Gammaproteobacteria bacterium]